EAGLYLAMDILKRNPGRATDFRPFVFFLSNSHIDDPIAAINVARQLEMLDIPAGAPTIVSIGLADSDRGFMELIASRKELVLIVEKFADLVRLFPTIGTAVGTIRTGEQHISQAILDLTRGGGAA